MLRDPLWLRRLLVLAVLSGIAGCTLLGLRLAALERRCEEQYWSHVLTACSASLEADLNLRAASAFAAMGVSDVLWHRQGSAYPARRMAYILWWALSSSKELSENRARFLGIVRENAAGGRDGQYVWAIERIESELSVQEIEELFPVELLRTMEGR